MSNLMFFENLAEQRRRGISESPEAEKKYVKMKKSLQQIPLLFFTTNGAKFGIILPDFSSKMTHITGKNSL